MKREHLLGILALAMISVLGVGAVSAYGFGFGNFMNNGFSQDRTDFPQQMKDLQNAIESNNYTAWANIMNERIEVMQSEINEENFSAIVEAYDNMTQVQDIRDELMQAVKDGNQTLVDELKTQLQELIPDGKGIMPGNKRGFGFNRGPDHGIAMRVNWNRSENTTN